MYFKDRKDAGIRLGEALRQYKGQDVIVYALPRGGVVLGRVIADQLQAPLDLVITKKIGHPMNPEYAICAIAEEGAPICNPNEISKVDPEWFQLELNRVRQEIRRLHHDSRHQGNEGTKSEKGGGGHSCDSLRYRSEAAENG